MRWLYLHFPTLLLDHYRAATEVQQPLALLDGQPPRITQSCPNARNQGVEAGQAMATAQALCPDLVLLSRQPQREQRLLEQLAQWVYSHAAPLSPIAPCGLVIQATPLTRLYGGTDPLREALLRVLHQHRLSVQTGFGLTPLMARRLAEWTPDHPDSDDDTLRSRAAQLPVTAMDWPAALTERLYRMGLRTLGDLQVLDPGALQRRLGTALYQDLQRLQGTRPDPVSPYTPPAIFDQHLDLPQEVPGTDALLFPLQRLVQRLGDFLRLHQRLTDTLWLCLAHPDQPLTRVRLQSASGQSQPAVFMELIRLRLERLQLTGPVIGLRLRVTRLLDAHTSQSDLLDGGGDHQHRAPLLSRLMTRLGPEAVLRPALINDWRPERATAWHPVQQPRDINEAGNDAVKRPLWLLPAPAPLKGPPALWLSGPERLQTGWWEAETVQRDYYRARFDDGRIGWLFRAPGGDWFIHGWFG